MKELNKKLFEIQGMNLRFEKTEDNPFFKSKYVPLEAIQEKLAPILQEKELLVYHKVKSGGIETSVVDIESEAGVSSEFPINPNIKPQEVGSAITYGKRYNLGALFNIITDDDDDGNKSSVARKPSGKKKDEIISEDLPF